MRFIVVGFGIFLFIAFFGLWVRLAIFLWLMAAIGATFFFLKKGIKRFVHERRNNPPFGGYLPAASPVEPLFKEQERAVNYSFNNITSI